MVSQDLSLEYVSDRTEEMAFLESMFQYLKVDIGVLPGGSSELFQSKVMKSCNLDLVEGCTRSELG